MYANKISDAEGDNLPGYLILEGVYDMETTVVKIRQDTEEFTEKEDADLKRAGKIICKGGLVACPTETE